MTQLAGLLIPHVRYLRNYSWRDGVALILVVGLIILFGTAVRQILGSFKPEHGSTITLSPLALPLYALRTVMRMLCALIASLIFTFTYATLAAKSRRAEMVLIPILDVLQSVPILGYLSFTAVFFVSLFPGRMLGAELASMFAIFTSQAWNMAFSFYQSLIMVPRDLDEVSRSTRCTAWQRFWRLEVPFAMPALVWNMMMSMSGGWFFVVAAESISVGKFNIALPGIGSYVAEAIEARNLEAIGWAVCTMTIAIVVYDQFLFRPLVAWAEKFRVEQSTPEIISRSWVLDLLRRSSGMQSIIWPVKALSKKLTHARLSFSVPCELNGPSWFSRKLGDRLWIAALVFGLAYLVWELTNYARSVLTVSDIKTAVSAGALTFIRVAFLILLASAVWVPIGIAVGLKPRVTQFVQPIVQFLAAFPANLFYPVAVFLIVRFQLSARIWLVPLMILGTQWYILFNVIAGASVFPTDFREAAQGMRLRSLSWWTKVILPGIFPYYITGAITASGGAWNASIVSEAVRWGPTRLDASGLGAYIARMTDAGDYARIALGIAVMSAFVVTMNRLLWRPLYALAESRTRLD